MAKHSKWQNIKHRKAAQDAKKAKIYTKIWKIIQIAARNWADPSLNPVLQVALDKAKEYSVPKNVIDNAINKWSWQSWWEQLQEIFYEWYWPWWTAIYIKSITWNINRSSWNIRAIFTRFWCNMWEPWSVSWQFKEKWIIYLSWKIKIEKIKWKDIETTLPIDNNELEETILEINIEDYETSEEWVKITTNRENLIETKKYLEKKSFKIESWDIEFIPENYIDISEDEYSKLEKLIESFEDYDDVDTVYHNAN
jgi:YebC/PmpR family DNA-binding regulatory protein